MTREGSSDQGGLEGWVQEPYADGIGSLHGKGCIDHV